MTLLTAAGVNFIMGLPGGDDIMLNYQSTSFHDILTLRHLFNRPPAPEFEAWLQRLGMIDSSGRLPPMGNDSLLAQRLLLSGDAA